MLLQGPTGALIYPAVPGLPCCCYWQKEWFSDCNDLQGTLSM